MGFWVGVPRIFWELDLFHSCSIMLAILLVKRVLRVSSITLSISGAELVAICMMVCILLSSALFISI